ncbi:MAG: hypothetical protein WDA00_05855 [Eubacteriales bacterium]
MPTEAIRLFHTGQVFLDCPFPTPFARDSAQRREQTRRTFVRLIDEVGAQGAHLLLISGNLFDNEYATVGTADFLSAQFARIPAVQVVIAPGPHDAFVPGGLYACSLLPANVFVFETPTWAHFAVGGHPLSVYGWAYAGRDAEQFPFAAPLPPPPSPLQLVCGYAELGRQITHEQIEQLGACYTALSGSRNFRGFSRAGGCLYAESGVLESGSFDETGFGGANLVTLTPPAGEATARRLSLGRCRYESRVLDVSGLDSWQLLSGAISALIAAQGYGTETALHVQLEGTVPPGLCLPPQVPPEPFGVAALFLSDKTLPLAEQTRFARDMSIRGEVYRTLLPRIEAGTGRERERAAQSLKIAFSALDNRDIFQL